jgi:hypothetical protein
MALSIRLNTKRDPLYAFVRTWPESRVARITRLDTATLQMSGAKVPAASLLGYGKKPACVQNELGLSVPLRIGRRSPMQSR